MTPLRRPVKGGPAVGCVNVHARPHEQLDGFQVALLRRITKRPRRIGDTQPIQLRTGLRRRPGYHGLLYLWFLNHRLLNHRRHRRLPIAAREQRRACENGQQIEKTHGSVSLYVLGW